MCASEFCILSSGTQVSCVLMVASPTDRVGRDSSSNCLPLDLALYSTTTPLAVGCAKNSDICFDPVSSTCKLVSSSSGSLFIGIDSNFNCLMENVVINIGIYKCLPGYCIKSYTFPDKACVRLNISDPQAIGKDQSTGICLSQQTITADECAFGDFCIASFKCIPLSEPINIGRGSITQKCVSVNSGTENANRCFFPDYCLEANKCQALSHMFPNRIGRHITTQACLPVNTVQAVSCALHYCLKNYNTPTA